MFFCWYPNEALVFERMKYRDDMRCDATYKPYQLVHRDQTSPSV